MNLLTLLSAPRVFPSCLRLRNSAVLNIRPLGSYAMDLTEKDGYTIHWIYTTEKRKRDRIQREERLLRLVQKLAQLMGKLNTGELKSSEHINERVKERLKKYHATYFYHIAINPVQETSTRQIGKGHPGKHTRYTNTKAAIYTLSWNRVPQALKQEKRVEGIFPLLSTDGSLSAKATLQAYKFQLRLGKAFSTTQKRSPGSACTVQGS